DAEPEVDGETAGVREEKDGEDEADSDQGVRDNQSSSLPMSEVAPVTAAPITLTLAVMATGLRVFLADQVLGLHLPVIKLCLGSFACIVENRLENEDQKVEQRLLGGGELPHEDCHVCWQETRQLPCNLSLGKVCSRDADADPNALVMNVTVQARFWSDYFNSTLRCWETLLDPFQCLVLAENCTRRGSGLTVRARSPLHINVTAALLDTLSD
ncbi:unnamed protein product, partial [Discosporangium mesarthrocarpum]